MRMLVLALVLSVSPAMAQETEGHFMPIPACPSAALGVHYQIFRGNPETNCSGEQQPSKNSYECGESVWRISPPSKPTLKKWMFVLGLLFSLAAPILFMFGRHARPEIGLPMYAGGLALMLVAALL